MGLSADLSARSNRFELSLKIQQLMIVITMENLKFIVQNQKSTEITYDSTIEKRFSVALGKQLYRNLYAGARYRLDFVKWKLWIWPLKDRYYILHWGKKIYESQDYVSSSITPYLNYDNTDDFYFSKRRL